MKIFATLAAVASAFGPQFPSEASNSQFYLNAVSQALTAAQNQVKFAIKKRNKHIF